MNRISEWPDRQEIEEKVQAAIDRLLYRDRVLLEKDVNERSISHKLASYLQEEFGDEWNVDCEYNRNHVNRKGLNIRPEQVRADDTTAITVFPDIIVHHRDSDDNLLVIEIKKSTSLRSQAKDFDLDKLRAFRGEKYHYQHTLYLQLKTGISIGIDEMRWDDEAMP